MCFWTKNFKRHSFLFKKILLILINYIVSYKKKYHGTNLTDLVIASDGIVNMGKDLPYLSLSPNINGKYNVYLEILYNTTI